MPDRPQKRQRRDRTSGKKTKPPRRAKNAKQAASPAALASLGPPLEGNEYLELFKEQSRMFPPDMSRVLDPELPGGEERREELFDMIDADAALKYAWAVPDDRALRVRPKAAQSICQLHTDDCLCRSGISKLRTTD